MDLQEEFLNVDDLGDACVIALENWDPKSTESPKDIRGKPLSFLNVGTGKDISIKELALLISKIVGFEGQNKMGSLKTRWYAQKTFG